MKRDCFSILLDITIGQLKETPSGGRKRAHLRKDIPCPGKRGREEPDSTKQPEFPWWAHIPVGAVCSNTVFWVSRSSPPLCGCCFCLLSLWITTPLPFHFPSLGCCQVPLRCWLILIINLTAHLPGLFSIRLFEAKRYTWSLGSSCECSRKRTQKVTVTAFAVLGSMPHGINSLDPHTLASQPFLLMLIRATLWDLNRDRRPAGLQGTSRPPVPDWDGYNIQPQGQNNYWILSLSRAKTPLLDVLAS